MQKPPVLILDHDDLRKALIEAGIVTPTETLDPTGGISPIEAPPLLPQTQTRASRTGNRAQRRGRTTARRDWERFR